MHQLFGISSKPRALLSHSKVNQSCTFANLGLFRYLRQQSLPKSTTPYPQPQIPKGRETKGCSHNSSDSKTLPKPIGSHINSLFFFSMSHLVRMSICFPSEIQMYLITGCCPRSYWECHVLYGEAQPRNLRKIQITAHI